jgi:hypothetical protein
MIRTEQYQYVTYSGKRGSNPRHQAWEACTLPTELFPHIDNIIKELKGEIKNNQLLELRLLGLTSPLPQAEACGATPSRSCNSLRAYTLFSQLFTIDYSQSAIDFFPSRVRSFCYSRIFLQRQVQRGCRWARSHHG